MKNTRSLLIVIVICLISYSCKHASKLSNIDNFYTDQGDYDAGRIPFIKPYQAIFPNNEVGWCMNLQGKDGDLGFFNIKKANVVNGIMVIYSENSIYHGVIFKKTWHVIIPNKQIERGFISYVAYTTFLINLGIKSEPILYNMDSIADYFHENDLIDWKKIK